MTTRRPPVVHTITSAATILGISADYLRRMADEGEVPIAALTGNGVRLFNDSDIRAIAEERRLATRYKQPSCDE